MSKYLSCNDAEILFNKNKEDNTNLNILNILIQYINIIYNKIYENSKDVSNLNYSQLIDYFLNLELNSKSIDYTYGNLYLLIRKYIRIDNETNKFFNFNDDIKFVDYDITDPNLKITYKKIEIDIANSTNKDIPNNWRNNLLEYSVKPINDDFFKTYFQKNTNIEYKILNLIGLTNILIYRDAPIHFKYELYVYLSKLIEDLQKKDKIKTNSIFDNIIKNEINIQVFQDLKLCINKLKDNISFDPITLSQYYPQFIFLTRYDELFNNNNNTIKPYRSQIEVIVNIILNNIKENFENCGTLTLLNTITGEGKTTLAIPLAILANKLRHHPGTKFNNKKLEIIYCCNSKLKSNMTQIVNNAKSINLPFAVACTNNGELNLKMIKNDNYDNNTIYKDKRLLIIADIKSTIELLKKADLKNSKIGQLKEDGKIEIGKEFILFFDEPTSFLDCNDSDLYDDLYQLYSLIPANTILASATLPINDLLIKLESYYLTKYSNRDYKLIVSENSQIGSEIYDFNGNIYLPNQSINDMNTYKKIINKVESNLFLKKLYTPFTTSLLWNKFITLHSKYNLDLTNIDDFKVKYSNISLLNQKNIQNTALGYLNKIDSSNLNFFNDIKHMSFPVELINLRKLKNTFTSQTLIITKDPINFIQKYLNNEISSLLHNINKKFNKKFIDINDFINNIQLFDITKLIIQNNESYNNKIYDPRDINWNNLLRYNNLIICALLLGIGIYDPVIDDQEYTKNIIKLATNGVFSYIISTADIAYGTNFKIEYIIVDNTCFNTEKDSHSINTLFQLISRAGRRGISWKASIYCDYQVINMIKNFCIKDNLTIEDFKFNNIMELLFKQYNVKLINKLNNDDLFNVLKEEPLITNNDYLKNKYLQLTLTDPKKKKFNLEIELENKKKEYDKKEHEKKEHDKKEHDKKELEKKEHEKKEHDKKELEKKEHNKKELEKKEHDKKELEKKELEKKELEKKELDEIKKKDNLLKDNIYNQPAKLDEIHDKKQNNSETIYPNFLSKQDIEDKLKKSGRFISKQNYEDGITDLKDYIEENDIDLKNIDLLNTKLIEFIQNRSNISYGGGKSIYTEMLNLNEYKIININNFINPTLPKKGIISKYYISKNKNN